MQKAIRFEEIADKSQWNLLIESLPESSTYMTWIWGKYKERKNWIAKYLCVKNNCSDMPLGAFLLQTKKCGPLNIHLMQGGLHLLDCAASVEKYAECFDALIKYLSMGSRPWVLMIDYKTHKKLQASTALLKCGFSPVVTSKMFTYLVDCSAANQKILSTNWRHNLKRAYKEENLLLRWAVGYDERSAALMRLSTMYESLMRRKQFCAGIDLMKISDLLVSDDNAYITEAVLNESVVAVRIAYSCADHLLDLVAASSEAAKNCYANYLLLWEMILKAKSLGKEFFDTGGINPGDNVGVFNFKKGLGGEFTINGPVWCCYSNRIVGMLSRTLLQLA